MPSPFAASLLFSYVANFIYDGDAPLAERRAQALAVDQAQLRELLGDAELRELLDAESMDGVEQQLQRLDPTYRARTVDGVHDLLLAPRRSRRSTKSRARSATLDDGGERHELSCRGAPRRSPIRDRGRDAIHRRRGRGALPRRARRAAAARPPRSLLAAGRRSARRSRAALRAHACAVHRRRVRARYGLGAARPRPC